MSRAGHKGVGDGGKGRRLGRAEFSHLLTQAAPSGHALEYVSGGVGNCSGGWTGDQAKGPRNVSRRHLVFR